MQEKVNEKSFAGQSIYIGIDVHLKSWKVSIMTDQIHHKTFSSPPEVDKLKNYLTANFPGGDYYSAYEAGFSGYWLHRELTKLGIKSIVVNPADIPTTDKERKQKEDQRDSRKIAKTLQAGQLKSIYIPSEKTLQDRLLLRMRESIVKDLRRNKGRIKSLLYLQGINYPERFYSKSTHWSKLFISWLEAIPFEHVSGKNGLNILLEMVKYQRQLLLDVTRQMRELANSTEYKQNVELLLSVPGIGMLTAMKFLTELEDISRFKNFDQLCSYVGLVPSTNSSGENQVSTGITSRKNPRLLVAIIESSWVAVHYDPALLLAFQKLCKRLPANKAIVRIAKKLLRRIVTVLRSKEKYQKGIVK